ncbi:hypothetical protein [Sphingobium nicotianae]|uniref:Uncharacterized protein n=1 Tax=Sphingobium nicotianae TaxID=2782607 RepID=A0A9X1IPU5_9SPHN|nr:hypothetical protein [Sphingobium nicotianae]MBT2186269.1 hypothetical protein [Sphingobium nicotianae]
MASEAPDGSGDIQKSMAPRPARTRLIIALTLLAFVFGLAAMAWVMTRWQGGLRFGGATSDPAALATGAGNGADLVDPTQDMPDGTAGAHGPNLVMSADQQQVRIADLEQRLTRLSVAAEAASGYANRAEAMMVAFAARRALDAGAPLGYVEGQLRLLFGNAQPKAVATIVNAAAEPVTLNKLRQGLETIGASVGHGGPNLSWYQSAMRELRGLAVIQRAGAPSPEPGQRIARARLHVESGQIEEAITEIGALPQQPETTLWLEQARRYNEAHRALDVIEAAAVLQPRTAPMIAPVQPTVAPSPPAASR